MTDSPSSSNSTRSHNSETANNPSLEAVMEALATVEDPEIPRSIVELNMVRDVEIVDGNVTVRIALTVAGCPMRAEITKRVSDAVMPLDGVCSVHIDMTTMSHEELEALRMKLQGAGGVHAHGNGHEFAQDSPQKSVADAVSEQFGKTRILGISSGKGGVGKSSTTVNLAIALAKHGHRVGLLDADIYGFSVPGMLGLSGELYAENDKVIPPEAYNVKCISLGFFVDDDTPVVWRGPMLHKALEQFLLDVTWGELDYLLIDMPPGTGDVALSMSEYVPQAEVIVVTTPQPAAQRVAQRSGYMAREMRLPVAGVVENMSWFVADDGKRYELFGSGGGEQLANTLNVEFLGQIPLEPELREGGDAGLPIVVSRPESAASLAFDELASVIEKHGPKRVYRAELKLS